MYNDVARKVQRGYALPAKGAFLTYSSYVRGCLADGYEAKGINARAAGASPSVATS